MNTTTRHLKVVALFFSVLILFQGCTVYQSVNVTLDEAVRADNKVRIEKRNGEEVKYYRVVKFNDGNYYGKIKVNGMFDNLLIDENNIVKVQIKDQKTSTILTVAIPVVIIGVIIVVIAKSLENMNIF
jgi:hypothetical protein